MESDQKISFVEHFAPALKAGTYKIELTTHFDNAGILPEAFAKKEEWIFVGGERFNLTPSDIDSVYPPANGLGTFEDTLPHIVFTKAGIPWERDVFPPKEEEEANKKGPRASWLALLLFHEADPAPAPLPVRVQDLEPGQLPQGVWFPPDFRPEPDESSETACHVIDVPRVLFDAIKPSSADLTWLAHARTVSLAHKIGHAAKPDSGTHEYAVVIGNRLPRAGQECQVHLVSMESYQPILDAPVPQNYHAVRMVSLKNWRFKCRDTGGGFLDHVRNLNPISELAQPRNKESDQEWKTLQKDVQASTDRPIYLHFPFERNKGGQLKKVFTYLQQGFLPMEHQFRQGLTSVSWYRGAITPLPVPSLIKPPALSADALLIYDPDTGYYDVSYAAAWQLGQLMGLRNKEFSRALFFWKQQTQIDHRKKLEKKLLKERLPLLETNEDGVLVLPKFDELKNSLEKPTPSATTQETSGLMDGKHLHSAFSPPKEGQLYKVVANFIQTLKSLKGVPYNYLIPDPKMLPEESIRFFYLDPNWIHALIDGAMSLGDLVTTEALESRSILKSSIERNQEKVPSGNYSGFVLRSSMLKIWPGLEIRLRGTEKGFVRLDRLGEEVLLGIVEGELSGIELREPPEGLHFGVHNPQMQKDGSYFFTKKIRRLPPNPGAVMNADGTTTPEGVLQVSKWVQGMLAKRGVRFEKTKTGDVQDRSYALIQEEFGYFSTADFGFVMVEPVQAAELILKPITF